MSKESATIWPEVEGYITLVYPLPTSQPSLETIVDVQNCIAVGLPLRWEIGFIGTEFASMLLALNFWPFWALFFLVLTSPFVCFLLFLPCMLVVRGQ